MSEEAHSAPNFHTFGDIMKDILKAHLNRYPLMEPQDVMKLCFQSEFGPGHMVSDSMASYLYNEWTLAQGAPERPPEDIGGGLVRFHLTGQYAPQTAAPLLARLFSHTAALHKGTREGLEARLAAAEDCFQETGREDFLARFREYAEQCRSAGFPAVHHSPGFRSAYDPHYRLLRRDFGGYFPLLYAISQMDGGIVAIDGACGSGKTQLARLISSLFDCNVIHMDDYYLPINRRSPDWQQLPGGNMDFARLCREALCPLAAGSPAHIRPYCCTTGTYGKGETLFPKPLTILEGSYSLHPQLRAHTSMHVFLTCNEDIQLRRLTRREGAGAAQFQRLWIPMEQRYHAACPLPEGTFLIDTSSFFL